MKKTTKLSRKIQLQIDLPTVDERKAALKYMHQWQQSGFQAANIIISHLFVQEVIEGKSSAQGSENFLDASGLSSVAPDDPHQKSVIFPEVVHKFQETIPLEILEGIDHTITRNFQKEKALYLAGKRSIKSYNKNLPLPFDVEVMEKFRFDKNKKAFCFSLFSVPLKTYLGRDVADKKLLLDQFLAGDISLCSTRLQINNNKLFLMAVFVVERDGHVLIPDVVAEASLSSDFPIVLKIGQTTFTIGSKEEFLFRRLAIQAAYKRLEDGVTYARAGKGKKRKTKSLIRLQEWEQNYVHHRMHLYSRILIDHCIQNKAGTLVLTNEQKEEIKAPTEATLLRDWDYYELSAKIENKAQKAGIQFVSEPVAVY